MSCRLLTLFLVMAVATALKIPSPRTHSAVARRAAEQDIKDLNLEEMFEVFDKADKTVKGGATNTAAVRAVKPTGERSASVPYLPRPKNLDGLVGNKGFDPIGFSDFISPSWLREAELKHGRIAMLATAGWVFTYYHNPVLSVGPLEAHNAAVASGAAWQVLAAIAGAEFVGSVALKVSGCCLGNFLDNPILDPL